MNGVKRRLARCAMVGMTVVLWGAALGRTAYAQEAPPFPALLKQSEGAPRAAAIAADVAQAEGLAEQARARSNPSVSVQAENIAGSAPYSRFDAAETTLQINQPFELGGKRFARIAAGEAGVGAAKARGLNARVAYRAAPDRACPG